MARDGSAAGRLQMGLHRLAQQQMDGLNERAQAERFFQPGAHALRHSLFKLRLLLRDHDNRQGGIECAQWLEDVPAHLQWLVEVQQQQFNVPPVVGRHSLLSRGCPENLELFLFQGTV